MKPYPSHFSESNYQSLIKRRESALLPDEPRDDSVPMELQEEDGSLPTISRYSPGVIAAYFVVGAIAFGALYLILR